MVALFEVTRENVMKKFQIITDSASDLPEGYYREHDVDCLKLGFNMDGKTYGGEDGEAWDASREEKSARSAREKQGEKGGKEKKPRARMSFLTSLALSA